MYGVVSGHERAPAGCADRVHVVVVKDDAAVSKGVDVGGGDLRTKEGFLNKCRKILEKGIKPGWTRGSRHRSIRGRRRR